MIYLIAIVISFIITFVLWLNSYLNFEKFKRSDFLGFWALISLAFLAVAWFISRPVYKYKVAIYHCNGIRIDTIMYLGTDIPTITNERNSVTRLSAGAVDYLNYCKFEVLKSQLVDDKTKFTDFKPFKP